MRILYIIATYLVLPIVFIHMLFKSFNDLTYLQRIGERLGYYKGEKPQNILWVHAVSYGEIKAAIPLINKLRINFPQKRVKHRGPDPPKWIFFLGRIAKIIITLSLFTFRD